ncbi:indoleamine 2,3-dioxygenase 2-like [Lingula anatina]|uniref:Indoleamine 2,3-dioxygenase 2-like n=1 Tax=Lingula anatina TaxID=7574 RepID=A0A1S3IBJ4_LINAN|nr:indoleamine 2,3-dioxygenase 2-like [Lingula anatina]|eukprot:XP_013395630.1 indoleamine 2,3-dioxygenase 2-like [Lingula anatina]
MEFVLKIDSVEEWWERLEDFRVSEKVGFLVENPLEHLPEYFRPWEILGKKAAKLTGTGELKDEAEKLPYLDYNRLKSYEEYCLAHSLLSTIAHCYVWQDRDKGVVPEVLPRAVAVPWYHVSQYLGLNPVYCYLACILANWRKESEDSCDIELICCAPGSPNTDWFFIVTIQIEIDFGKGVKDIIRVYQSLTIGDDDGLIEGLQGMADTIQRMQQTLARMHEAEQYLRKIREYMPVNHREFLNAIENGPSLRNHVRLSREDGVRKAYNKCIQALTEFRSYHFATIVKYILLQSYKKNGESSNITEAQGAGGTYLIAFLKSTRDQTARCILGDSDTGHVTWQADDRALVGLKMEERSSLLHPGTNRIVKSKSD